MHHMTTFLPVMECIRDGGPVRLQWSWISCKTWQGMWFRRNFFSLAGAILVGLGNRFPLTRSTSILRVQITSQTDNHWPFPAQRSLYPQRYNPRKSSLIVFRVHCCKIFPEGLRSCTRHRSTGATLTSIKCCCHFRKSSLW